LENPFLVTRATRATILVVRDLCENIVEPGLIQLKRKMTGHIGGTMDQQSTNMNEGNVMQNAKDKIGETAEQMRSGISEVKRKMQSGMGDMGVNGSTIPDAFREMPKMISPGVHRWLDVAVTGYFLSLGVLFAVRGKAGAAIAAFVNGGMVAGVSMFTDYEGTGEKPISFKLHGTLDAVQATTAALAPVLHGFAGEPEAAYFYGQAVNEVAVIATTDWDQGMQEDTTQRQAA
jgi:hypothetical protein